jgi:hypothetical protein
MKNAAEIPRQKNLYYLEIINARITDKGENAAPE